MRQQDEYRGENNNRPRPGAIDRVNRTCQRQLVPDERAAQREALQRQLACDGVILSGGTSKGAGDLSYSVVAELEELSPPPPPPAALAIVSPLSSLE